MQGFYFHQKQITILIALALFVGITTMAQSYIKKDTKMKVAVWDTYVTKKERSVMHFDIIAPEELKDTNIIYSYGRDYLKTKGQEGQPLTSKECRFCHIEIARPQWEAEIKQKGYFIIEMENCK